MKLVWVGLVISFLFLMNCGENQSAGITTTSTGISGVIQDSSGHLVDSVGISLRKTSNNEKIDSIFSTDGKFLFDHLPAGTYHLQAFKNAQNIGSLESVAVNEGQFTQVTIIVIIEVNITNHVIQNFYFLGDANITIQKLENGQLNVPSQISQGDTVWSVHSDQDTTWYLLQTINGSLTLTVIDRTDTTTQVDTIPETKVNAESLYVAYHRSFLKDSGQIVDERDQQTYSWVAIQGKIWMSQNLNYGTMIQSKEQPKSAEVEKYCYNNDPDMCQDRGAFYYWSEMVSADEVVPDFGTHDVIQGKCPEYWHISSEADWLGLEYDLGCPGQILNVMGSRSGICFQNMKTKNLWTASNGEGTDTHGFHLKPGGAIALQAEGDPFISLADMATFWLGSKDTTSPKKIYLRIIGDFHTSVRYTQGPTGVLRQIRCVLDLKQPEIQTIINEYDQK